jgi:quinolinate synthase
MADAAVKMAAAGVRRVIVLGVDFMSENVRAMLDAAGFMARVECYRVASEPIGCSLAESAESRAYEAYLASAPPRRARSTWSTSTPACDEGARPGDRADDHLHVVQRRADRAAGLRAGRRSPRVVRAGHLHGPNLARCSASSWPMLDDETIAASTPRTIARARPSPCSSAFTTSSRAICIVHHMFGADRRRHRSRATTATAFVTAHLEVPGEMFELRPRGAAPGTRRRRLDLQHPWASSRRRSRRPPSGG